MLQNWQLSNTSQELSSRGICTMEMNLCGDRMCLVLKVSLESEPNAERWTCVSDSAA